MAVAETAPNRAVALVLTRSLEMLLFRCTRGQTVSVVNRLAACDRIAARETDDRWLLDRAGSDDSPKPRDTAAPRCGSRHGEGGPMTTRATLVDGSMRFDLPPQLWWGLAEVADLHGTTVLELSRNWPPCGRGLDAAPGGRTACGSAHRREPLVEIAARYRDGVTDDDDFLSYLEGVLPAT